MRVPQNIPLCKEITVICGDTFISTVGLYLNYDDLVPIYTTYRSLTFNDSLECGVALNDYLAVYASKSYNNYEPPKSYILPNGYQAVTRTILVKVTYSPIKLKSNGLGFIYIIGTSGVTVIEGSPYINIAIIDIVKK